MLLALLAFGCTDDTSTTDTDPTASTADTGPVLVTDLFPQTMVSPVDILLVIDPRWSAIAPSLLEAAFEPTWDLLLVADPSWQIGVLDATEIGSKTGLITKIWGTWPPPRGAFDLGAPGSAEPRFREITYTALELRREAQNNEDFLRSGASLYVVYMGAAADGSTADPINQEGFDEWLGALVPSSERHLAAITDSAHVDYWQERVIDASVFEVGGLNRAIKNAVLEATGLETSFQLSEDPEEPPQTVEVIYREHATIYELEEDYTFDAGSRTISFIRDVPRPSSTVRVIYAPEGSGAAPTATDAE
jgi:hypothetical protein